MSLRFGYTIIYVNDVEASLAFFERAFGIQRRFYHESGYGELATGETTLAYASHELGRQNLPSGYVAIETSPKPVGIEIGLVTESVDEAYQRAIEAGATILKEPQVKPWGQTVAYIRCPDGTLVELCSPVDAA